jgi:hypothetical protein
MKTNRIKLLAETAPIVFTRADPSELAKFDPKTKYCHMNCGPHREDPRSEEERQFLCEDCYEVTPNDR